jgi:hypothetical protein
MFVIDRVKLIFIDETLKMWELQCDDSVRAAKKSRHAIPPCTRWLAHHPRWTFHFTPTSASWLNAVEGFFAILTKRRIKRGVSRSLADLQAAIL